MTSTNSHRRPWNPLRVGKTIALQGARRIGIYSLLKRSEWRRQQLLILAYHGISQLDEHQWRPALYMSPEMFASRLTTISQSGCTVLPLDEALCRLKEGTLPSQSVVLTFDDGFFNFYQYAYPILKRFHYPATVYQTTYYVTVRKPIFHLVTSYLFWKSARKTLDAKRIIGTARSWDLSTQQGIASANFEIWQFAKSAGLCGEERQRVVENLAEVLGVDYGQILSRRMFELMTKAELSQMARAGVDFQLHTHRHRVPTSKELLFKEFEDNKRVLTEIGQPNAVHFAYPSGVYRQELFPWLTDFGIRSATTCEAGLASRRSTLACLPRFIDTSHTSAVEFEAWLCGMRRLLPGRT
jgi:peptidoglycan/xylan/chitin deacetylase (PgdA/CDA1 family)